VVPLSNETCISPAVIFVSAKAYALSASDCAALIKVRVLPPVIFIFPVTVRVEPSHVNFSPKEKFSFPST